MGFKGSGVLEFGAFQVHLNHKCYKDPKLGYSTPLFSTKSHSRNIDAIPYTRNSDSQTGTRRSIHVMCTLTRLCQDASIVGLRRSTLLGIEGLGTVIQRTE